ncbi:MAG: helix-turn-helix transcriptional regulator [Bacteroidales bacterium]
MKDRLQRFLELEQLTPAKLADILDVQRSGLSHILSGRNNPGFDFINKLLTKFPSLNSEWLITGKGRVYKEFENLQIDKNNRLLHEQEASRSLFSIDSESVKPILKEEQLPEKPIFEDQPTVDSKNKTLKKVLMIYSDNSFTEYFPGEDK